MINETNGRVNSAVYRSWPAWESVCFDNSAEWVLTREVVVKGQKLALLLFRKESEL